MSQNTRTLRFFSCLMLLLGLGVGLMQTSNVSAATIITPMPGTTANQDDKLSCKDSITAGDGISKKLNDICETDGKCVAASRNGDLKCYHGASTPPPVITVTPNLPPERKCQLPTTRVGFAVTTGEGLASTPQRACVPADFFYVEAGWPQDKSCLISESKTENVGPGSLTVITLVKVGKWDATAKKCVSTTTVTTPESNPKLDCANLVTAGDGISKKRGDICETDGTCASSSRAGTDLTCSHATVTPPVITITPGERKCVLTLVGRTTTGGGLYSSKQRACVLADGFYAEEGWVQDQACLVSDAKTGSVAGVVPVTVITLVDGGKWDATAKKCVLPAVVPPVTTNPDSDPKLDCNNLKTAGDGISKKLNDICETDGKCVAASRNGDLKCYHGASTPPPEIIVTPGTNTPRACLPLDYIFSPVGCRCVILNRAKGLWEVGTIKDQGGRQLCIVPAAPETKPIDNSGKVCLPADYLLDGGIGCRCVSLSPELRPVLGQRAKNANGEFYCKVADTTVANTSPADGPRLCTAAQVITAIESKNYAAIYGCKCNPLPVPGFAGGTIVEGPNNFPICKSDSDGIDTTKPRACDLSEIARDPGKVIGCACSTVRGSRNADGIVGFLENKLKCNAYSAQN
jgi:hypothetical protein